jgi:hypothetical protein
MLKSLNPLSLSLSLEFIALTIRFATSNLNISVRILLSGVSRSLVVLLQWCNLNAQAKQETSKQGPRVG